MEIDRENRLLQKYTTDSGVFYFYDCYIIAEIKEGVSFSAEKFAALFPMAKLHYGDSKPFGYISNRKHSYSISPLSYLKYQDCFTSNFMGYALVVPPETAPLTISMEKHFAQKPLQQFDNLEDAIAWMVSICSTQGNQMTST